MPHNMSCDFPPGYDATQILQRLERVLDPELDESVLHLGFIGALRVRAGRADVALQLPTAWCAVNFAYLMAEDVRNALLMVDGVRRVTVRLGDHCAAAEIEAAVNGGRPFAEAFPGEGAGSLEVLRLTFQRKGFHGRQERVLRDLRGAGLSPAMICTLQLGDASAENGTAVIRCPGSAPVESGSAEVLQRYLERRAELGLDCANGAPLIVDLDGEPLSVERLETYYETARTMRVAMEANGSFCRAVLSLRDRNAAVPA